MPQYTILICHLPFHGPTIATFPKSLQPLPDEDACHSWANYQHAEHIWIQESNKTSGYIPLHSANQIVNDRSKQGSLAQQGLLASAPTARPASAKIRCAAKRSKRATATAHFFEASESPASPALPEFTEEAYRAHWTGSMACLDMANVLEVEEPRPAHVDCFDTSYMGEAHSLGFVDSMAGEDLVDWDAFVPPGEYQEALLNMLQYSPPLY